MMYGLGPAPNKPYNPETLHFNWRGLWDYGTGAMGDMGAHIFDAPIWALNLGMPTKYRLPVLLTALIICLFVNWLLMNSQPGEICLAVKVTWCDGGLRPPRPEGLKLAGQ